MSRIDADTRIPIKVHLGEQNLFSQISTIKMSRTKTSSPRSVLETNYRLKRTEFRTGIAPRNYQIEVNPRNTHRLQQPKAPETAGGEEVFQTATTKELPAREPAIAPAETIFQAKENKTSVMLESPLGKRTEVAATARGTTPPRDGKQPADISRDETDAGSSTASGGMDGTVPPDIGILATAEGDGDDKNRVMQRMRVALTDLDRSVDAELSLDEQIFQRLTFVIRDFQPGTRITNVVELAEIAEVEETTAQLVLDSAYAARLILALPDKDPYVVHTEPEPDMALGNHVEKAIRIGIDAGILKPGDKLPSGDELINVYGLSRRAAKAILKNLKDSELTDPRQKGGTFVRKRDNSHPEHGTQVPKRENLTIRQALVAHYAHLIIIGSIQSLNRNEIITSEIVSGSTAYNILKDLEGVGLLVKKGKGYIVPDELPEKIQFSKDSPAEKLNISRPIRVYVAKLPAGIIIPSSNDLSTELGMNRKTIIRYLGILEAEHVLVRVGQAWFKKSPTKGPLLELERALQERTDRGIVLREIENNYNIPDSGELPSIATFVEELQVHPTAVTNAIALLLKLKFVQGKRGSRTVIKSLPQPISQTENAA